MEHKTDQVEGKAKSAWGYKMSWFFLLVSGVVLRFLLTQNICFQRIGGYILANIYCPPEGM